jgi:hypothetical protein
MIYLKGILKRCILEVKNVCINRSLEANNFYGPIPSEIGNLVNLQQL